MEKDDSQIYANGSSIAPSEAQTPKDSTRSPGRLHWAQEETTTAAQEPEDDHAAVLTISSQTMPPAARIFYGVYLGSSGMIEAAIAQGAQSTAQVGFSMTSLCPWLLLPPPPPCFPGCCCTRIPLAGRYPCLGALSSHVGDIIHDVCLCTYTMRCHRQH